MCVCVCVFSNLKGQGLPGPCVTMFPLCPLCLVATRTLSDVLVCHTVFSLPQEVNLCLTVCNHTFFPSNFNVLFLFPPLPKTHWNVYLPPYPCPNTFPCCCHQLLMQIGCCFKCEKEKQLFLKKAI